MGEGRKLQLPSLQKRVSPRRNKTRRATRDSLSDADDLRETLEMGGTRTNWWHTEQLYTAFIGPVMHATELPIYAALSHHHVHDLRQVRQRTHTHQTVTCDQSPKKLNFYDP